MFGNFTVGWEPVVWGLAVVLYMFFLQRFEKRYERRRYISDEEYLTMMARMQGCSEYDIVHESGKFWNLSKGIVEEDFKEYLKQGDLPYYVRDYVRRNKRNIDENYRPFVNTIGRIPTLWIK